MKASYIAIALSMVVVVVLGEAELSMAATTCNAIELSPCASAITSATTPPTRVCCTKLKEQKPCLCQYLRDPNLKKFVNTPNARKVARTCGTPFPRC